MALCIGVAVGSRIAIGEGQDSGLVEVKQVSSDIIVLSVVTPVTTKEVTITDHQRTEILKDVFVQVGVGEQGQTNRLAFEAPRAIRISRLQERKRAS